MEWRSACRLSEINDATRSVRNPGLPYRAILYGDGSASITDCDGRRLVTAEADRFHDWEPVARMDPITALGKVASGQKTRPLKALGRTSFDDVLGGLGW